MPVREALPLARRFAARRGISRVTDITRLDRVGVPVFASVRPKCAEGSLCVNAGKGLTRDEARIGAYMEAVEFAMAEPGGSRISVKIARARDVLDGATRSDAILDLCPIIGKTVALDTPILCVEAEDVDGGSVLVPAELVFHPFWPRTQSVYFGSTTNGLASGMTLNEATVHGLFEVIERDVASFEWFGKPAPLVSVSTLPRTHRETIQRMLNDGFSIALRWLPNEFAIPCFHAILWERDRLEPLYVTEGYGCHLNPAIAVTRALTEAVQSRLTLIHGARDDIEDRYRDFEGMSTAARRAYARRLLHRQAHSESCVDFATCHDRARGCADLDEVLRRTRSALATVGIRKLLRVRFSGTRSTVSVVRIIVPLLEFFTPKLPRIGRRLAAFASHA